ncbi:C-X-C chemokine receptor type 3-2-like [Discoglossus pictus]
MEDSNISNEQDDSLEYYTFDYSNTQLPDTDGAAPCKIEATTRFNKIFIPVAFSLVFILDLIGNGLVLRVLMSRRCAWHLADHYLFQLAISDLLLGVTLPFWATQFGHGWIFGKYSCKLLGAMLTINMYSGIFFLTCISMNRYFSIVHAVELHKKQTRIHTFLICFFVWGISCILSWQEFYFRDVSFFKQLGTSVCYLDFYPSNSDTWRVSLHLVNLSLGFLVPLLLMCYFYSRIFCTLRHSRLGVSYRSQVVIVVLLLIFVICWAPYNSLMFTDSLLRLGILTRDCELEKKLDIGLTVTESLGLSHVCLNPIIYAFVGVKFRQELSRIFKRGSTESMQSGVILSRLSTFLSESNHSYSRVL